MIDTVNANVDIVTVVPCGHHQHLTILILIILISGLVGGVANYFKQEANMTFKWFNLVKSMLLGLVASAIVPLFLEMLQSQLLYSNEDGHYNMINYFVFTGFCLIAAYSSIQFLQSVSDKVISDLEEVKKKTEALEEETNVNSELVGKIVEVDTLTEATELESYSEESEFESTQVKATPKELLNNALSSDQFTFLTIAGLSKVSGLSLFEVEAIMAEKILAGEVKEFKGKDGKTIYALTQNGKNK